MAILQNHIQNLRTKPEHIRKQVAFWYAFVITLIIFFFWLGAITGVSQSAGTAVAKAVNQAGTPTQSLIAGVGSFFVDIKDLFFTPKRVTYSTIEVRPGK